MKKVYLTGAGPGDIELMTLKAARVIKEADVIIYDKLANPEILEMAKDGTEFIFVGKEFGKHLIPQDEINEIIYQNEEIGKILDERLLKITKQPIVIEDTNINYQ